MKNKLLINGLDAYTTYGVFICDNCYNELLCFPPMKKVNSVEWQEENGEEFDLSSPKIDAKKVSLSFAHHRLEGGLEAFFSMLESKVYHDLEIRSIGRTFRLRILSCPKMDYDNRLSLFTVQFSEDMPYRADTFSPPSSMVKAKEQNSIDDMLFSQYGVILLNGTIDYVIKKPDVKQALTRNINSRNGVIHDSNSPIRYKSKDVTINCLFRADDLDEFWNNYDALFFTLTKPEERVMYISAFKESYACFYKKCQTKKVYLENKIWFEFSLTFTFTHTPIASNTSPYKSTLD